jgi:nucleoside-diphosphate-sugar epimerase
MRVLITGATGFLGRQVSAYLDRKHEGYALIRKHGLPIRNIQQLNGDILQPCEFEKKLKKIDAMIHLAAINKARTDIECKRLFETNVVGTFNMLELARKKEISKFIFASSAAVYGDKKVQPVKESFSPNPRSLYGLSKSLSEQMCIHYGSIHGFSAVCLRISNMYGPDQPPGFVASDLFVKSKLANVIKVKNPSSTRDFVYVEDVARALEKCLDSNVSGIINIGSGKETSIQEIAIQLGKFLCRKVVTEKEKDEEVRRSVLDISKARDLLNWEPEMPLEKGLRVTWQHLTAQEARVIK